MRKIGFRTLALVLTALFGALFSSSLMAHKGASGIVKTRMDAMRALKNELKLIDEMLAGKKTFRKQRLARTLANISLHTGGAMTKLFPKGSHMKPSEADPIIWTSWSEFAGLATELKTVTERFLASVESKPASGLKADYSQLRGVCKSCHDRFRE